MEHSDNRTQKQKQLANSSIQQLMQKTTQLKMLTKRIKQKFVWINHEKNHQKNFFRGIKSYCFDENNCTCNYVF